MMSSYKYHCAYLTANAQKATESQHRKPQWVESAHDKSDEGSFIDGETIIIQQEGLYFNYLQTFMLN